MGEVKVAGQDADLAACQRIAEGSQYATIYKPIDRLALKAAGFAVMLAPRASRSPTDAIIDDGAGKVPYVRLEPILVTKELLDATVIKDGFHSRRERLPECQALSRRRFWTFRPRVAAEKCYGASRWSKHPRNSAACRPIFPDDRCRKPPRYWQQKGATARLRLCRPWGRSRHSTGG